jgi:hypothetical protein
MHEAQMSDPEIARRCIKCGASARPQAAFCSQCGNPITQADTAPTQALGPDLAATQPLSAVAPPSMQETAAPDGVLGKVEKFRKVSSVVIDQAAYDPSLRFLLVAAGLFLLFLVLLILSKVIG